MTRVLVLALAFAAAAPAGAFSLFGHKKKAGPAADDGALPGAEQGTDQGGGEGQGPTKMAEDEEQVRKELGLEQGQGTPQAPAADAAAASTAAAPGAAGAGGELPQEVTITGTSTSKLKVNKPPLAIDADPFESIRDSLKPDEGLLLAESPLTVVWRRTHPEFLDEPRVVQPNLTTFSERPGILFSPLDQLTDVLGRKPERKEERGYQWSLTLADEEGKVFQHYEGSGSPPEEIVWSGENDQGDWIRAGRAYSPVYMFTDPGGTPYTRAGAPLRFKGVVHQERDGLHVSLDSSVLFGTAKADEDVDKDGQGLLRSAADLVKRKYTGVPVRVEAYAGSKALADKQAQAVEAYLSRELMVEGDDLTSDALTAGFADQRVEVVLVNR